MSAAGWRRPHVAEPVDHAARARRALARGDLFAAYDHAVTGLAQGVGYTMAAAGPLLVGVLHDRGGGWGGAGWLFALAGVAAAAAGSLAGRNRLVGGSGTGG